MLTPFVRRCAAALFVLAVGCEKAPGRIVVEPAHATPGMPTARLPDPPGARLPEALATHRSPAAVAQHRFIAPPGEGPPLGREWYQPPHGLKTKRILLSPAEAADIENRMATDPGVAHLEWKDYVLLFEKVGSDDGEKVVVRGYARSLIEEMDSGRQVMEDAIARTQNRPARKLPPPEPLTVERLRNIGVDDGGCIVWRVIYDVRSRAFGDFECNGEA